MEKMKMSQEPREKGYIFENLMLAWNRLSLIKKIIKILKGRKVYSSLPETVKDDVEAMEDIASGVREDAESTKES